ncbi:hypothetical protein D3C77_549560 [compost metagenome]
MLPRGQLGDHYIAFVTLINHLQERFEVAIYALQVEALAVIGVITHHGKFDDGRRQIGIDHLDLNIEQPFFSHDQTVVLAVILVIHGITLIGENTGLFAAVSRKIGIFCPLRPPYLEGRHA